MAVLRRLIFLALLMVVVSWPFPGRGQTGAKNGEWRAYGAEEASTRYSPVDQINRDNVKNLEVAWTWRGDNFGPAVDYVFRSTPIYVDGILYTVAGQRRSVAAIDPRTGETLWIYREPNTTRYERGMRNNYGKGVAYGEVNGRGVIYSSISRRS